MKIKIFLITIFCIIASNSFAEDSSFEQWLVDFKKNAMSQGISITTLDTVLSDVKYLPNVIKYDRYQPEFYEDTKT